MRDLCRHRSEGDRVGCYRQAYHRFVHEEDDGFGISIISVILGFSIRIILRKCTISPLDLEQHCSHSS